MLLIPANQSWVLRSQLDGRNRTAPGVPPARSLAGWCLGRWAGRSAGGPGRSRKHRIQFTLRLPGLAGNAAIALTQLGPLALSDG